MEERPNYWRDALLVGLSFVAVGIVYLFLQGSGETMDRTGATLLIVLGAAMAFAFALIVKSARGL